MGIFMIQALTLLTMALQLLIAVNNPNVPEPLKQQAISTANFAIQVANNVLKNSQNPSVSSVSDQQTVQEEKKPIILYPQVTLSSNKHSVASGEPFNLTWKTVNANYCEKRISPSPKSIWDWREKILIPPTENRTYSSNQIIIPAETGNFNLELICFNHGGDYHDSSSITIEVK